LIYVGTDDGRIHVTKNGGSTWAELTIKLPYVKWVSEIAASAYKEGTVYLAQNGKRDDDFAAYIWKSDNYGQTWKDITGNIPCGPVNVIKEDPKNKDILYVGTDLGAYVTLNGGKDWHLLACKFPTTYVHDLIVHPRENILVAATHGRGMYAMDVSNVQQMTSDVLAKNAHLFEILPVKLPRWGWWRWIGKQDAYIYYYLKAEGKVKLTVKDNAGKTVRELKCTGDAGMNRAAWDLMPTPKKEDKKGRQRYPFVKPGKYTVVLTAGTVSLKGTVEVKK
jgi:hypothetical protein